MNKKIINILISVILLISYSIIPTYGASQSTMPEASGNQEMDVWLIAGQSNAMGMGLVSNYPTTSEYSQYKTLLTNGSDNVWYFGNTDTDFTKCGFGKKSMIGPEIGFATALSDSGKMNAVIKMAYGNTSLYNNTASAQSIEYGTWTPPSYIEKYNINTIGNRTGDLYLTFMKKIETGLEKIRAKGYTPVIKGIWYMQGEADTFSKTPAESYSELLETLISDMRKDLTDITGTNCLELPFVFGRIYRNPGIDPDKGVPYADATPYVPTVQAAQDAIGNKNLKNVIKVNTLTELIDPVTKEHREPVLQDGWHYDSLSQQMIGEKFVKTVQGITDIQTKYGFIPYEYRESPFAVFKYDSSKSGYVFDSAQNTTKNAMLRARTLTLASAPQTSEAVILLMKNYADKTYPSNMSDVGGTITLDLNNYTLGSGLTLLRTDVDDCMASGETTQKECIVNIKNGTLNTGEYGIIYNSPKADTATYTKEKRFIFNLDNMTLGFYDDYSGKTDSNKFMDLLVSDRNYYDDKDVYFDINLNKCTLNLFDNARADARMGIFNTHIPANDKGTSKYNVKFKDCTFIAKNPSNLGGSLSSEGDSISFVKGSDGYFGKVKLPANNYNETLSSLDDGHASKVKFVDSGITEGDKSIYNLVASASVNTAYGAIPANYSDSGKYPLVVFKKNKGESVYTFVSGYNAWKSAVVGAGNYIKGSDGATKDDEGVILLRRDFSFSDLYTSSVIGGTLTLDLNGYNFTYGTSLMNTYIEDFSTGKGGNTYINIKNGNMLCNTVYGMFYNKVNGAKYTKERAYIFNFDNVNISYAPEGTAKSLLNHLYITNDITESTPVFTYDMTFNNCVIDMRNAPDDAYIAKLDKNVGSEDTYNKFDHKLTFKGGRIIGNDESDIAFVETTTGDTVLLEENSSGKYPEIIIDANLPYPSSLTFKDGEDNILTIGSMRREKLSAIYTLKGYKSTPTPYGKIPPEYTDVTAYPFVIFTKNVNGYSFYSGYNTYKLAMTAAINLTKASNVTTDEAVVYLRDNWSGTGYPSGLSDVATKITIDLNGYTLGALESMGNTATQDSKNSSGTVVKTNGTITVKNGTLLAKIHGFIYMAKTGTYTKGMEKTLNFNFEDVNFGFAEEATAITLIGRVASSHTTETAYYNLNFSNCIFDTVTNRPSRTDYSLANWSHSTDYTDVSSVYTDCRFIGLTENDIIPMLTAGKDKVVYKKTKGVDFVTLTIPKTASTPTAPQTTELGTGNFEKISESDSKVVYGLRYISSYPYYLMNNVKNQNDIEINKDTIKNISKIKLNVSPLKTGANPSIFIAAFYDENDKLISAEYAPYTIDGEYKEIEIEITKNVSSAKKLKLIGVTNFTGIKPLCNCYEIIIE